MPIFEYTAESSAEGCDYCKGNFEQLEQIGGDAMKTCPRCGAAVRRVLSAPQVGRSATGMDDRAKNAGFHKLKKLGNGEFEKLY